MAQMTELDAETRERINRGILLRTGAYLVNDHFALSHRRHTSEYVEKALVTTEPAFTEGLGEIIAKHFAKVQVDVVLTTGYGASILGHCVARAHPSRPHFIYATKRTKANGTNEVVLRREFHQLFTHGAKVLIVEDILTTGETVKALIKLVHALGGEVVGIGTIWRRSKKITFKYPLFTLVDREFPTYSPQECPMCRKGIPINRAFGGGGEEEQEES